MITYWCYFYWPAPGCTKVLWEPKPALDPKSDGSRAGVRNCCILCLQPSGENGKSVWEWISNGACWCIDNPRIRWCFRFKRLEIYLTSGIWICRRKMHSTSRYFLNAWKVPFQWHWIIDYNHKCARHQLQLFLAVRMWKDFKYYHWMLPQNIINNNNNNNIPFQPNPTRAWTVAAAVCLSRISFVKRPGISFFRYSKSLSAIL